MWIPIINALIGLWLMISPGVLKMNEVSSDNNHITGPLVITFSVIALWQINRKVIRVNILIGTWLLISLFVLDYIRDFAFFGNAICGLLLIILSSLPVKVKEKFGGGWHSLVEENPLHLRESKQKAES
ncbi:MAG: vitamin K epoxide reductase [Candidatus Dadabacteria bacterium]